MRVPATKDTNAREVKASAGAAWGPFKQAQNEQHLMGGISSNGLNGFRSEIQFVIDWTDIAQVTSATMLLFTVGDHAGFVTAKSNLNSIKVAMSPSGWVAAGGGEGGWTGAVAADDWDINASYVAYGRISDVAGTQNAININAIVNAWVPKTAKGTNGAAGKGLLNHGMELYGTNGVRWAVASMDHPNVALRPVLVLEYVPKGGSGLALAETPTGPIPNSTGLNFTGHYEPGRADDHLAASHIVVTAHTGGATAWDSGWLNGSANDVETNTFSAPLPASLKSLTDYDWKVQVRNQRAEVTPFSAVVPFRLTSNPPSLALVGPSGTFETLAGVTFQATYSDPDGPPYPSQVQVQVRDSTPAGDPLWDSGIYWWDSGLSAYLGRAGTSVTDPPGPIDNHIRLLYQGKALGVGSYSFRMRASDQYAAVSPWVYGTFSLTKGYEPSPGDTNFLTGYGRHRQRFRIRIFGMGALRGPGTLLAELYDAANVGASESYNAPGEFFFTLPAIHPQVAVIEPFQTHLAWSCTGARAGSLC